MAELKVMSKYESSEILSSTDFLGMTTEILQIGGGEELPFCNFVSWSSPAEINSLHCISSSDQNISYFIQYNPLREQQSQKNLQ